VGRAQYNVEHCGLFNCSVVGGGMHGACRHPVSDYKELIAYQKAYALVLQIYKLTDTFPKAELYGLSCQIRRAAVSIPSNIAEGFMRGSREYVQFLKIALGSAAELETQLSLSKDLGYCSVEQFNALDGLTKEVLRLLTSYISTMKKRQLNS
jgi:four helix bundle protein